MGSLPWIVIPAKYFMLAFSAQKKTIPREPWQTLLHLNDHQVNLRDVNQPTNHNRGFKESYVSLSSNDIHRKKEIHSRSLTARPWAIRGSKHIFRYWVSVTFQRTVQLWGGMSWQAWVGPYLSTDHTADSKSKGVGRVVFFLFFWGVKSWQQGSTIPEKPTPHLWS